MTLQKNSKIEALIEFDRGFDLYDIIGIDEAGRGTGAGDVFAAAVYFPQITSDVYKNLACLDDSKKLSKKTREELYDYITKCSIYSCKRASIVEIDKINILHASLLAMHRAAVGVLEKLDNLSKPFLLIDGNKSLKEPPCPQTPIIGGDGLSFSIAAASIIAKVERDRYMDELAQKYPQYDWDINKGYFTLKHRNAINRYGITSYHRKSFFKKFFSTKTIDL